jgi:hypothetical protein
MVELVGTSYILPPSWKQHLLLFDRIACLQLASSANYTDEDLAELVDRGLVFKAVLENAELSADASAEVSRAMKDARDGIRRFFATLDQSEPWRVFDAIGSAGATVDAMCRAVAVYLREVQRLHAVPITSGWESAPDFPATKAEVLHLVVNELPIPSDRHSLDDLLAFRDEAHSEGLIQGLRVWINEMACGRLTQVEVSDKLEDLVFRYERALKLESMQRDTHVVETLVVTTAEIAESLVKFQWSKIAKKLFEVRHKQIDLMKAEMTAPGREVAYIVKARERFRS